MRYYSLSHHGIDHEPANGIGFVYPLFGWGIGIITHTFRVFARGQEWEERKLEELTGPRMTQDKLSRLSERTDTLIAILADVNWEKIDPDLSLIPRIIWWLPNKRLLICKIMAMV